MDTIVRDGDEDLDDLIDYVFDQITSNELNYAKSKEIVCHTDTWYKCTEHDIDVCIVVDSKRPNLLQINPYVWKNCSYYVSDLLEKDSVKFKIFCTEPIG